MTTATKGLHVPVWLATSQAPTASQQISCMTTAEDGTSSPFIYYLTGTLFYRYDTIADSYQKLATPRVAAVTGASMKYTAYRGYHGRIISATSTTVQIPGLRGTTLDGVKLSIERGTGLGQERTLTYVGELTHEAGVITGTTTSTLADSTKKWKFNQWAGYMVAITFGTGATEYRKVLYNDTTTLYIADANLMPHDPWNNQVFTASAPYAVPVITAGLQAHYEIMSSTYTVPAWTTIPDYTSYFTTRTGGIYLLSSAAATPFITLQYYDVLADTWVQKSVPQSLVNVALGTDFSIERPAKTTPYISSTATSATANTLSDTVQTLEVDRYRNYRLNITGGTGIGQSRRITCSTANKFTVNRNWDITPDATSTYEIHNDYRKIFVAGGAMASMLAYNPEVDAWHGGEISDTGVTSNITCKMKDWEALGVSSGVRIAAGVVSVASAPTAGGTGYTIGDILTCSVGGIGAQVIVTAIAPGGIVSAIELVHSGTTTGFTTGTGKATTGGTGTGCTINITAIGATALITLATAHWFDNGEVVTFAGCTEGAWNTAHTIIGINSTSSFSVAVTATANMAATASQSTTTIVDPSANWTVNEHAGKLVQLVTGGLNGTNQTRWIVSNTATVLTVATIVAGVNGTSRYAIYDSKLFGVDVQGKPDAQRGYGHATGGSTTTLADSTKNWVPNMWVGYRFKLESGPGFGAGMITITSNTETTLTYAVQTFTPTSDTHYTIFDTWGLLTASTTSTFTETGFKNWTTNQWAGKRLRISGGLGIGQEASITSNTNNTLTTGVITAGDATTPYAILSTPARGSGINLMHIFGSTAVAKKGRFLFSPRGSGSNTVDIYDITTGRFEFGYYFQPQSETPSTGSYYSYDGADTIFFSIPTVNDFTRVFAYNVLTNKVVGAGTIPDFDSTLTIGNRMEIVDSSDGKPCLYYLQNTSRKMFKSVLWYI